MIKLIEIKNVTKKFGDFTALNNLSMSVGDGSVYGLVGYNGAGKTTLLKIIAGVYKPDEGEVTINGRNTYTDSAARLDMFYVPDEIFFEAFSTIERMAKFYAGYYPSAMFFSLTKKPVSTLSQRVCRGRRR